MENPPMHSASGDSSVSERRDLRILDHGSEINIYQKINLGTNPKVFSVYQVVGFREFQVSFRSVKDSLQMACSRRQASV